MKKNLYCGCSKTDATDTRVYTGPRTGRSLSFNRKDTQCIIDLKLQLKGCQSFGQWRKKAPILFRFSKTSVLVLVVAPLSIPVLFNLLYFFIVPLHRQKNEALVERKLQEIPLLSLVFVSHFPSYFLLKQTKMFYMKKK